MNGVERFKAFLATFRKRELDEAQQELRDAFFEYNRDVRIANSKIACMLVIVLMPVGVSLDYYVYPQLTPFFFVLRMVCSLLALILWRLLETSFGYRHFRVLGMGWFVLPTAFISLMIYYSEGALSPYYAGLNLVMVAVSWVAQVDFLEGVIASLLTLLMYTAACVAHGGGGVSEYFNNYYFIVLTGVIVVTGNFFLNKLRFREFAFRTEVDRSRRELEESHKKLVELDKAKTTFFANVSHELRTPLTLLIGPLEQLRHQIRSAQAASQVEMLDIMYNNAMRLLRLINDLLDLVRLDSGAIRVTRRTVELVPFMEGIALSVKPMADQRKLEFTTSVDVPKDQVVYMDRDKVEKITLNLLFNSFKFTPPDGTVRLDVRMREEKVLLTVTDSGKGISPEDLPRVFDRFWQADANSTRSYQGVGIGLALVKELTEAHGGSVQVQSELGKGTAISVELDVRPNEQSEEVSDALAAASPAPNTEWLVELYRRAEYFPSHVLKGAEADAPALPRSAQKQNILVADDEPEMRRFLISQLKDIYNIREAHNGSEALKLAQEEDFVLILLDLMMPGIDGITLTKQLRQMPRTASVPVIILTARTDEQSKMGALEVGATDFLTKPFASSELIVRCRNLVSWYALQRSLEERTIELQEALEQLKATEAKLVHQAKMASLGQLSAGLMHEINNPLNFANTAAHLIKKRLGNIPVENRAPLEKPLTDLMDGIARVAGIVTNLRSFAHPGTGEFTRVNLREVIDASSRFVQLASNGIQLDVRVPADINVWGDRNQLVHLFVNLMQNSADSLREKGASDKHIEIEAVLQNEYVRLTCKDNGTGIKSANLDKVFDAFYTTKPVGKGMGLGLNLSHRIVQNHQGEIRVESKENEYCEFIITLKGCP